MGENMFKRFADTVRKAFSPYEATSAAAVHADFTPDMVDLSEIVEMFVKAIKENSEFAYIFDKKIIICINRNCLVAQLADTEVEAEEKMFSSANSEGKCTRCGAVSSWCRISGGDIKRAYHDSVGTSKKWRDERDL